MKRLILNRDVLEILWRLSPKELGAVFERLIEKDGQVDDGCLTPIESISLIAICAINDLEKLAGLEES